MPLHLNLFVLVLAATCLFSAAWATCYFPDGSTDADGFPCNLTTGAVTHCCRTFEACIDNGICYTQWDSQFYRRSCTDASWSDGCPTVCTDVARDGGEGMLACSQGTNPTYCCANGTDGGNCCSPSTEFNFIPGEFLGVLDAAGTLCPPLPVATTITRTTTANAQRETTSSNSSSVESTSTSSAGVAAASETSPAPSSSSSSDSSTSRTIGLAVGIPLGVLLIASIAGLVWFFNRKLNQEKAERRRLEERLFNLIPANDSSKQPPVGTNIWEKDDAARDKGIVAEIGPAERRNEMPVDKSTAYEVGSPTQTGTHSSETTYN